MTSRTLVVAAATLAVATVVMTASGSAIRCTLTQIDAINKIDYVSLCKTCPAFAAAGAASPNDLETWTNASLALISPCKEKPCIAALTKLVSDTPECTGAKENKFFFGITLKVYEAFKAGPVTIEQAAAIRQEEGEKAMRRGAMDVLTVIPVDEIADKGVRYVKSLVDMTGSKGKWGGFWSYFQRTWMQRYHPSLWNVHAMSENGVELVNRTNNPLEKYNRDFGERFPNARPSLLTFIEVAKADSLRYVHLLEDVRRGDATAPAHAQASVVSIPDEYTAFQ